MRWAWLIQSFLCLVCSSSSCPPPFSEKESSGSVLLQHFILLLQLRLMIINVSASFFNWEGLLSTLLSAKIKCRETWEEKKRVSIIVRSVRSDSWTDIYIYINSVMKRFSSSGSLAPLLSIRSPKGKHKCFSYKFKSLVNFPFFFFPCSQLSIEGFMHVHSVLSLSSEGSKSIAKYMKLKFLFCDNNEKLKTFKKFSFSFPPFSEKTNKS